MGGGWRREGGWSRKGLGRGCRDREPEERKGRSGVSDALNEGREEGRGREREIRERETNLVRRWGNEREADSDEDFALGEFEKEVFSGKGTEGFDG